MSRTAIVTGGSRGIGRAIAEGLKKNGCKVAATYAGNDEAAAKARAAGLTVIQNRCPKIELFRPFWKPRLDLPI